MFRTVEVGAWYRIRLEGRNVFAKILERRGRRYRFQYLLDDGGVANGEASRSEICGRLGDQFVSSIESSMAAAQAPPVDPSTPDTAITPGEWRRFEHEGSTVAGVVYGSDGDQYMLFILHKGIPTFVTLPHSRIGPREERLTRKFQAEMAKNPNYLQEWVSQAGRAPEPPAKAREPAADNRKAGWQPSQTQKRLFPK
jgi:hypothetical protein